MNPNMEPLGQRGQGRAELKERGGPARGSRGGGRGGNRGRGRGGARGRGRGGGSRGPERSSSIATSAAEKRRKTQMLEDIKMEMEKLGLEIGNPCMEAQKEPGTLGEKVKVLSNVYGVKMANKTIYRYDITISAKPLKKKGPPKGREPPPVEFTKRTKEDCVIADRRDFCRIAFECFSKKYSDIFGDNPYELFYDLQCILYTLKELKFGPDKSEETLVLNREDIEAAEQKALQPFKLVQMLVRKVNKQVELGDLSLLTNDMTKQNHSLPQFLELATSQHPLQNPEEHVILGGGTTYLMHPEDYGFVKEDGPVLSEQNKYLAIGVHKSIHYVEGPAGRNSKKVGLIIESKKTPFHSTDGNLLEKTATIVGSNAIANDGSVLSNAIAYLNQQLKGLYVMVHYPNGRTREIRISGVSQLTAATNKIQVQDERVTVEEYFRRKYEQKLEFPNAPLATSLEDGKINYYPMEICYVRDNQRAQLSQLNAREVALMIKSSAVPPNQLKRQIESSVEALKLKKSPYLEETGVQIMRPLVADARRLPPPQIIFGGQMESMVDKESGQWKMRESFLLPATIEKWAIYLIPAAGARDAKYNFTPDHMQQFIKAFILCCRAYGIQIDNPADWQCLSRSTAEDIDDCLRICKNEEKCDFVFFITSDAIKNLHNVIKSCEQKYEIVTQDLKLSNACEIVERGKPETVQNIVCKTNEKMGGMNYTVKLVDPSVQNLIEDRTLFIGLGISHPGAMGNYERARGAAPSMPSVTGFAANMKKDPFDFVGDFVYDEARRDEKFTTLAHIVSHCVNRYKDHHCDGPKRLILFRNGTSEGQFGTLLQYEIPLVKHALKEMKEQECKLTVIVTQKTHNIRLFAEPMGQPDDERVRNKKNLNIKPGTVVDAQLTHPEQSEFYLASHTAIQGTTRTPRYSILHDENSFTMDQIEQICYSLAYGHKIINSPTSLPAPVYIALMYAKRGRAIFEVNKNDAGNARKDDGQLDYEKITDVLCYANTELKDQRTNA